MKLGFIGLGNMGGPMCRNLIANDRALVVHDVAATRQQEVVAGGAAGAASPAEVAAEADFVFASLPGPAEIEAVALGPGGILEGAKEGLVFVDLSTNSPASARKVAAELAKRGIAMLDAPVSGGVPGAKAATLSVIVGGEKEVFDRAEPHLKCIGENVYHVGGHGAGCTMKLVNNMISFCNLAVANEGMMLGVQAGVDPEILLDVISTSSGASAALRRIRHSVLPGKFGAEFALDLAHKDLRLALQLGEETGSPLMFGSLLINLMRQAVAYGLGHQDLAALVRVLEIPMNREVRAGSKKDSQ